jgi:hypothetical protein
MKTVLHNRLNCYLRSLVLAALLLITASGYAQEIFDDFEGSSRVNYCVPKNWGKLDTSANPAPDKINPSQRCAKYKRSRQKYDYIKVTPNTRMPEIASYASYDGSAPKITLKVNTNAPPGTLVEIQFGKKTGNAYPEGTHSQFQAYTSVSGEWETLEFKYSQTPKGSETQARHVDQMTLLFAPGTNHTYVFYFDDLTGPASDSGTSAKAGLFRRNKSQK